VGEAVAHGQQLLDRVGVGAAEGGGEAAHEGGQSRQQAVPGRQRLAGGVEQDAPAAEGGAFQVVEEGLHQDVGEVGVSRRPLLQHLGEGDRGEEASRDLQAAAEQVQAQVRIGLARVLVEEQGEGGGKLREEGFQAREGLSLTTGGAGPGALASCHGAVVVGATHGWCLRLRGVGAAGVVFPLRRPPCGLDRKGAETAPLLARRGRRTSSEVSV
jgi:hypothetical protein